MQLIMRFCSLNVAHILVTMYVKYDYLNVAIVGLILKVRDCFKSFGSAVLSKTSLKVNKQLHLVMVYLKSYLTDSLLCPSFDSLFPLELDL